jgi:hypothetical protein
MLDCDFSIGLPQRTARSSDVAAGLTEAWDATSGAMYAWLNDKAAPRAA